MPTYPLFYRRIIPEKMNVLLLECPQTRCEKKSECWNALVFESHLVLECPLPYLRKGDVRMPTYQEALFVGMPTSNCEMERDNNFKALEKIRCWNAHRFFKK